MPRLSRNKFVVFALVPAALAAGLFGAGLGVGRYLALRDVERAITADTRNETLGQVVDAAAALVAPHGGVREARADFAKAYLDPARAEAEMGAYAFSPPMVPAPFVGHAPAPGLHANALINAQQLRHEQDLVLPKPDGLFRVFVTGGSTAFGAGAPSTAETITGYLQTLVDTRLTPRTRVRYEIVNAATPALTSTQERIFIAQRLSEWEPDLVVSFSGVNDAHWGALGRDAGWFRSYADTHYFKLLNVMRGELGLEPFADVAPRREGRVPAEQVAANLAKNVALAAAALAPRQVPYVFVLQPVLPTTGKRLTERERARKSFSALGPGANVYLAKSFEAMRLQLSQVAIPRFRFVDLTPVFDAAPAEAEIFLDSYHFGDRGNQLIAAALFRELAPFLEAR